MASRGTFQKLRPLNLLAHLSNSYDSAYLQVCSKSVTWSIHLEQGKITYASHSVDPFDRLDRHLRRLRHQIPTLVSETRSQLRLMFENDSEGELSQNADYQGICWLVNQQYLSPAQAADLIQALAKEVIESFILIKEGSYELREKFESLPEFCQLDLQPLVEHCKKQLQDWQSLGPQISSPYQRPYFAKKSQDQDRIVPELREKLSGMLKGFSFRHLAVLLNQDELKLAQSLHPYIVDGTVLLHQPDPPFDQLPVIAPGGEAAFGLTESGQSQRLNDKSSTPPSTNNVTYQPLTREPPLKTSPRQNPTPTTTNASLKPVNPLISPPPSQQLPKEPAQKGKNSDSSGGLTKVATPLGGLPATPDGKKNYTIVCVDDSPTMLKEISYFLDDESFSVFTISDSVKALMQIIRHKPDLILLDVRMSTIDGYELCRLLRNHSLFKDTPIVMVTGNTGLIDRVKARLVGASGYLTKPFTQSELLKMVFRHLT